MDEFEVIDLIEENGNVKDLYEYAELMNDDMLDQYYDDYKKEFDEIF